MGENIAGISFAEKMERFGSCVGEESRTPLRSLRRPLAEEIRHEIGIDGNAPSVIRALEKVLNILSARNPLLITGEDGVGKKKFAKFFHRMGALSECYYLHISCEKIAKIAEGAFNLSIYLMDHRVDQQKTLVIEHPEFLSGKLFQEFMDTLFPPENRWRARIALIISQCSFAYFFHRLDERRRKLFQENMVHVPSLRERRSDMERHILEKICQLNQHTKQEKRIALHTLNKLVSMEYAKNFHSLYAMVEMLYENCDGTITLDESLLENDKYGLSPASPRLGNGFVLDEYLRHVRANVIMLALEQAAHNFAKAANLLGVKIQELEDDFRSFMDESDEN
jgi:DNA-binding NtrC family response regulator